jgi:hypothetical protein
MNDCNHNINNKIKMEAFTFKPTVMKSRTVVGVCYELLYKLKHFKFDRDKIQLLWKNAINMQSQTKKEYVMKLSEYKYLIKIRNDLFNQMGNNAALRTAHTNIDVLCRRYESLKNIKHYNGNAAANYEEIAVWDNSNSNTFGESSKHENFFNRYQEFENLKINFSSLNGMRTAGIDNSIKIKIEKEDLAELEKLKNQKDEFEKEIASIDAQKDQEDEMNTNICATDVTDDELIGLFKDFETSSLDELNFVKYIMGEIEVNDKPRFLRLKAIMEEIQNSLEMNMLDA